MFEAGTDTRTVARHIRRTLKMVRISRDEQKRLDARNGLNLKQRMPDGWDFETGDVFARLKAAGIEYRLL